MAEPKFEKDLERLEKLVESLEEGGLSLDDALKKFEEGIKLAKRCELALNAAEKKIELLIRSPKGVLKTKPFENEDAGALSPEVAAPRGDSSAGDSSEGESDEDDSDEEDSGEDDSDDEEEGGGLLF